MARTSTGIPAPRASLPTSHGPFQIMAYRDRAGREHAALVCGDVEGASEVPLRMHSECLTGDVFGSLRCDCREQLEASLLYIQELGTGVILYMRQEGRGIGLENKIRAYALQEQGLDTNQANEALGFRADERTYDVAADMLAMLGIRSVRLMSNNPTKLQGLASHGVHIADRIPVVVSPNPLNERYLQTKQASGHLLNELGGIKAPYE